MKIFSNVGGTDLLSANDLFDLEDVFITPILTFGAVNIEILTMRDNIIHFLKMHYHTCLTMNYIKLAVTQCFFTIISRLLYEL